MESLRGVGQLGGGDQEIVDHLDEAVLKADIGLEQGTTGAHAGGENRVVAGLLVDEHILTRRDVCVSWISQQRPPDITGPRFEGGNEDGASENVVEENGDRRFPVVGIPLAVERGKGDIVERLIRRCDDLEQKKGGVAAEKGRVVSETHKDWTREAAALG